MPALDKDGSSWEVQAVYFMRPRWNESQARAWLSAHNFEPIKAAHSVGHEIRYRIREPSEFSRFRTKILDDGPHLVFGEPN